MKFLVLILKNVGRNPVRSTLTALGTMVLVFVVTLIWSVLEFLNQATSEKTQNLKAVISEKWQIPSQMPLAYATTLVHGAARDKNDIEPMDAMTWQFYAGAMDLSKRTLDTMIFAFCMEPSKLLTMMDELDELPPSQKATLAEAVKKMEANRQGIIIGRDKLKAINKRVGDRFKVHGLNYKEIDLELEIVGVFPDGRYNSNSVIHRDYLNSAMDAYPQTHKGQKHPLAEKSLNLVWLRVPNTKAFNRLDQQIESSPNYSSPAVKCETASSGIATFLESFRDLIWGMRWLLAPAILVTLSLVISNAISISVRERRMELAVLKVLGFRPFQILCLVLGEALLIGSLAGLTSAALTFGIVNYYYGGIKFPIAFFAAFMVPPQSIWWGLAVGAGTAFLGSFFPAWSARSVKVSDVFAKVA